MARNGFQGPEGRRFFPGNAGIAEISGLSLYMVSDQDIDMSNFQCEICGANIYDSDYGYLTGCEHYPTEVEATAIHHKDYKYLGSEKDSHDRNYEINDEPEDNISESNDDGR